MIRPRTREADVVIMAIGQKANLKFITEADGIKLTPRGLIEADPVTKATSREGVFAGGDVVTGPWIAIGAVAAGREAAISIDRYLSRPGPEGRPGRCRSGPSPRKKATGTPSRRISRRSTGPSWPPLPVEEWIKGFKEINLGYNEEQAVAEAARCINCGICSECMQCVEACQAGAVAHELGPENLELEVGAVILAPGFTDLRSQEVRGLSVTPITPTWSPAWSSSASCRASGPFAGHLVRPSDHKEPQKIAWLQCVGSRDLNHCDNSYCSAVCCMYAIKQAVIAKEHSKDYTLDAAIFFMDMRTHGKDFEKYYWRAQDEHGVRFIRSRVHTIDPVPGTDDVAIRYLVGERAS